MDVKKRILQLCDALGISVNNLADRSGVAQSTIRNITLGTSTTATVRTIENICEGLEIDLEDFFRESDNFPAPALQELQLFKTYLRWKYGMIDKK